MQTFQVTGMTCGHCAQAITTAIKAIDDTATIEVDLTAGHVTVRSETAPPEAIAQAIENEGYQITQA